MLDMQLVRNQFRMRLQTEGGGEMIIKKGEKLPIQTLLIEEFPETNEKSFEDNGIGVKFDTNAVSILQSVFNVPEYEHFNLEANTRLVTSEQNTSKSASIKFMLTSQDEKNLLNLGYSQTQIDKFKPQEAAEIIRAGKKP
jgi:hypothetical protein